MSKWPHQSEVDGFYGDPRGEGGEENKKWVAENIIRLPAPWSLVTAWDFMPVKGVRIHKKCEESLSRIFLEIWQAAGEDQKKINEWGMSLYAGGFNYRLMRGSSRLSMHSWGCAIDFDSARNSFGDKSPNFALLPAVRGAFEREGWTWGGGWEKPDGMHWQAADI
ncbi:M15 family metallopeptidase [Pseudomonas entomophila]|uniref:M15 family metallopeptidase n=1 Tax=Pseudomonas entomophila TaxID=312306 RepID=UPI00240727E0|nr:M15 family metallopeptidase [Pseudomonas entomophila]MDF9618574.1 M15 family metallopeptidase [Pseudomonas entomophila]